MASLTDHILTITNKRPTEEQLNGPKRRSTFIPITGQRVNVWRMISHDPDREEDDDGVLVEETADFYFVQLKGDSHVSRFEKKDRHGVTAYRIHKLLEAQK